MKKKPASATMLVAKEKSKQVQDAYSVQGIPANFLIDRAGIIQYYGSGFGPGVPAALRQTIDAALETTRK